MFKLYVVWPNGQGYTKDFTDWTDLRSELESILVLDDTPASLTLTCLDDDVAEVDGENRYFGTVQIGQSAVHGTQVRD